MYVQRKSETNRSDARMMHGACINITEWPPKRLVQNRPDARSSSPDRTAHAEQSAWTENEFQIMSIPPKSFAGRAPLVCGSTFLATADYETPNDHSIPLVYTTPPTTTINPLPAKGWPTIGELSEAGPEARPWLLDWVLLPCDRNSPGRDVVGPKQCGWEHREDSYNALLIVIYVLGPLNCIAPGRTLNLEEEFHNQIRPRYKLVSPASDSRAVRENT